MYLSQIEVCSVENGLGMRVSVFVSGCNFNCKNCFNQQSHNFTYGKEYTKNTFNLIKRYLDLKYIAGLSLLGGDSMWQSPEDIKQLIQLCEYTHMIGKTVWLWTGFTYEELFNNQNHEPNTVEFQRQRLFDHCDVVVDGRYVDEERDLTLKWRGSRNQRVLDVKQCVLQNKPVLLENEN